MLQSIYFYWNTNVSLKKKKSLSILIFWMVESELKVTKNQV